MEQTSISITDFEKSLDETEIYLAQIKNNTLLNFKQISFDNTYSYNPKIIVDNNDNIHITWKE